jgi:hypothetical protein
VLERFLTTAIQGGLRVKLEKCHFAQLVNAALGFVVGQRVRSLDPAKVNAVVVWPRPTLAGDCDRLLGFPGWLRSQCEKEFSAASAPLRNFTKVRLQKVGDAKHWGKLLENCMPAEKVLGDGETLLDSAAGLGRFPGGGREGREADDSEERDPPVDLGGRAGLPAGEEVGGRGG